MTFPEEAQRLTLFDPALRTYAEYLGTLPAAVGRSGRPWKTMNRSTG